MWAHETLGLLIFTLRVMGNRWRKSLKQDDNMIRLGWKQQWQHSGSTVKRIRVDEVRPVKRLLQRPRGESVVTLVRIVVEVVAMDRCRAKYEQKVSLWSQWVETTLLWNLLWKKRLGSSSKGMKESVDLSFCLSFFFFKMRDIFWKLEKNIWGHLSTLHPSLRLPKSPVEQNYLMAHT